MADSDESSVVARRLTGLVLGLAIFVAMVLSPPPEGLPLTGWRVAAVSVLMAVLWISEALPVAATALIPIAAFPLFGIATIAKTTLPYANPMIFLFLGGFIIALTMERWDLHTRIALAVLTRAGNRVDALIAAFMGVTAFLSMWVSNTATTLMMLPIAVSVAALARSDAAIPQGTGATTAQMNFAPALLLAVAYGASIGGLGTLVGTPPNAFLAAFMLERFGLRIGFAQWMALGLPVVLAMLVTSWWLLTRVIFRLRAETLAGAGESLAAHPHARGPMTRAQTLTGALFIATAALWVARPVIAEITGLAMLDDTVIAIGAALAAFIIPVDLRRGQFLMDWETTRRIPWGVLLLFGGGLTLADAISASGLAGWIGGRLTVFADLPVVVMVLIVVTLIIFLTELTSNTATTATFLPVLATVALTIGENPLLLAVPAALAASCAFMLPVATPPNAIVFGSGKLTVAQMVRAGYLLNLAGIVIIAALAYALLPLVFGLEPGRIPDWAKTP